MDYTLEQVRELQPKVLESLRPRRQEYIEALKVRIQERDKGYKETAEKYLKNIAPLRKPRGEVADHHTQRHMWLDAIWCGDITMTWAEEFFHKELEPYTNSGDPDVGDWYFEWGIWDECQNFVNEAFDEAFRAVMPEELHEILED